MTKESLKATAQQFFGNNVVEVILLPANMEDNIANPVKKE
jgi:hypothetical protein